MNFIRFVSEANGDGVTAKHPVNPVLSATAGALEAYIDKSAIEAIERALTAH